MKACTICREAKALTEFHRQASRPDGLDNWCKPCKAQKKRAEYLANREKYLARMAEYRKANPDKVSEGKKRARLKKLDEYNAKARAAYHANREEKLRGFKAYRDANPELIRARHAAYREKNREAKNAYQREYQAANREARQAYRNEWKKRRSATDVLFWLREAARSRISLAFRNQGYRKTSKAREMLGCDFDMLAAHLEAQFKDGMTWDNRGEWEIDHIIPLASATTIDRLMELCHYTNLQPLWQAENRRKGAKLAA